MLYQAYEAHCDIMVPVRAWAGRAVEVIDGRWLGPDSRMLRNLTAVYELIARTGLTHERPAFGIKAVQMGDAEVPVREQAVFATPFGTLLRFRKNTDSVQPRV